MDNYTSDTEKENKSDLVDMWRDLSPCFLKLERINFYKMKKTAADVWKWWWSVFPKIHSHVYHEAHAPAHSLPINTKCKCYGPCFAVSLKTSLTTSFVAVTNSKMRKITMITMIFGIIELKTISLTPWKKGGWLDWWLGQLLVCQSGSNLNGITRIASNYDR